MRLSFFAALLFAVSFALACAARDIPRPATLGDTLELMRRALSSAPNVTELTTDSTDMSLRLKVAGIEYRVFPDNLHRQLQAAASDAERGTLLDDHIASVMTMGNADQIALTPETLPHLRPVLRSNMLTRGVPDAEMPANMPFAGDLSVYWVIDSENTVAFVSQTMLDDAGLDTAKIQARAYENLAALEAKTAWEDLTPRATFLTFDGTYESSFALDPALWNGFRGWERLVMAVPARDIFILADGSDEATVQWLRRTAADIAEKDGYRLSGEIFRFDGTRWVAD